MSQYWLNEWVSKWRKEKALAYSIMPTNVKQMTDLEKLSFHNHHNNWFRQGSLVDTKTTKWKFDKDWTFIQFQSISPINYSLFMKEESLYSEKDGRLYFNSWSKLISPIMGWVILMSWEGHIIITSVVFYQSCITYI